MREQNKASEQQLLFEQQLEEVPTCFVFRSQCWCMIQAREMGARAVVREQNKASEEKVQYEQEVN